MATITTKTLVCDLHRREGQDVEARKRKVTIEGRRLNPDLCDPCFQEHVIGLVNLLDPPKRKRSGKRKGPKPADVRRWAKEHGVEVGATGRVPQDVVDQYLAAEGQ